MKTLSRVILCTAIALRAFAADPTTTSVSPASGSGNSALLTTVVTDADGAANINQSQLLINATLVGVSACFIVASTPDMKLYLLNDAGSAYLTAQTPGAATTAENSQCVLHAVSSSITLAGNTVTAVFSLTFKPAFVGAKNVYLSAYDGIFTTPYNLHGTWSVTSTPITFYVDPAGNNTYPGTSPAQPWADVTRVNSQALSAGDTVLFKRGGEYRGAQLVISYSGTAGSPITFGAYGSGAPPILNGADIVPSNAWTLCTVGCVDATHTYSTPWTVASKAVYQDSLSLTHRNSVGVMVAGSFYTDGSTLWVWMYDGTNPNTHTVEASRYGPIYQGLIYAQNRSYITVENLELRNCNYQCFTFTEGSNIIIQDNIARNSYHSVVHFQGGLGEAKTSNAYVLRNTFINNGYGRGMQQPGMPEGPESECVGVNFQGIQTGFVDGNYIQNQGGEGIQLLAGATNITVTNNVVINAHNVGYYLGAGHGSGGEVGPYTVAYNYGESGANSVSQPYAIAVEYGDSYFSVTAGGTSHLATLTFTFQLTAGEPVYVWNSGGALPAGLALNTRYWVCSLSGQTFKFGTASNCSTSANITGTGTGTQFLRNSNNITGVDFHHNIAKGYGTNLGLFLLGNGQFWGSFRNVRIHNNTFVNDFYGLELFGPTDTASIAISNNIVSVTSGGYVIWALPTVAPGATGTGSGSNTLTNYSLDRDLMYAAGGSTLIQWPTGTFYTTLAAWQAATTNGDNSLVGNPLFVNAANDWNLLSTSPAVNAGSVVSGIAQERQGSAPDMGRYEYAPGKLGTRYNTQLRNRYKASVYP